MSNSLPDKPDIDTTQNMSTEERLEALKKHYLDLHKQNKEMKRQLRKKESQRDQMRTEIDRLKRKKNALQSPSFYIATVQELLNEDSDNQSAVIKQHGNNREMLTDLPGRVGLEVEVGDRVTIDDSFNIQTRLESETDARAQAMEVSENPSVTYADIGGLDDEIKEVREAVEQPLNNADKFDEVGIEPPSGVLLYGPPGTGKTMMAKAVAREVDATFIKLAGSELVRKFIGEGARLVRDLFELAKEQSPSIIFIDEIDAIASERTVGKTSGDQEVQRTLMQLLSEMDGFENRGNVRVMAATNRYDRLDDAILRPGRFDRRIHVGRPGATGREEIFKIHTRDMNVSNEVDFAELATETDRFTGADIEHVTTEAGMCAVRAERDEVLRSDFKDAIERVREDIEQGDSRRIRYAY